MSVILEDDQEHLNARLAAADRTKVIEHASGALLRAGEYVLHGSSEWLYNNNGDPNYLWVGQILDIADFRDVPDCEKGSRMKKMVVPPPAKAQYVLIRQMPLLEHRNIVEDEKNFPYVASSQGEVQISASYHWHDVKHIKCIAFVFHIDHVNEGRYSCAGIRNAFIVREALSDNPTLLPISIDKDAFDPFNTPFGDCESYSKRMWNSISSIKELCWRSMTSSKSQWDGRTKHVHFPGVNKECMQYITHMIKLFSDSKDYPWCEDKMTYSKAKKLCHPNLSVSHKKRKYDITLLRVVDEYELDLVRYTLGSTFGVGLTHSAPSMASIKKELESSGKDISTVELQRHQTVRIVTCRKDDVDSDLNKEKALAHGVLIDPDDDDDDVSAAYEPYDRSHPQKRWIPFPGCDFFFEESTTTNFHVALRFKKLKGDASTVAKAQNGGLETRASLGPIETVCPRAEFRYKGLTYNVNSVDEGRAKCKLTFEDSDDSDCEYIELPVEEVIPLVKEYNRPIGKD
jgi:hypothetical protein